jgi:hypothetical protein
VAKDLRLSPDDILLGARATETTLKAMNLLWCAALRHPRHHRR